MTAHRETFRRVPLSAARGIRWPAIPDANHSTWLAIAYQLEQSQWWPQATLESHQFSQLSLLLNHAHKYVPFHRDRLHPFRGKNFELQSYEELRQIPTLARGDLFESFQALISTAMPQDHMPMLEGRSSGSTGKPVNFYETKVTQVLGRAFNIRNELWHNLDPMAKIASIQISVENSGSRMIAAQNRRDSVFPCGSSHNFSCVKPIDEQLHWLQSINPGRLITHPSNLAALAIEAKAKNVALSELKYISTLGEVLPQEVRSLCKEVWGVPVFDIYSCRETNILALQCPENDHYHIQSERVILEVLDDNDLPCKPGEIGRVVVTDLHNFAMPFIRYEVGDHAEVGEICSCGRTLPVIKQVLGRTRNMMVLPSGQRIWPRLGLSRLSRLLPIKQIQIIQQTLTDIEVKIVLSGVVDAEMQASFEKAVSENLHKLSSLFRVTISVVDDIPKSKSGKYEDFMSLVDTS